MDCGIELASRSMLPRRAIIKNGVMLTLATALGCFQQKVLETVSDPQDISDRLSSMEGITVTKPLLRAEKPDSPTIIMVSDIWHGSPTMELAVIEKLYATLGIKFVGVEGWAGSDADKARGREILNGEMELIRTVRRDRRFTVVPLEDPHIQLVVLKTLALGYYINSQKWQRRFDEIAARGRIQTPVERENAFRLASDQIMRKLGIPATEDGYRTVSAEVVQYFGFCLEDHEDYEPRVLDYPPVKNLTVSQRSKIGLNKMHQGMKGETRTGALVFGKGHTDSMYEYAKERKDVHFIVIEAKQ